MGCTHLLECSDFFFWQEYLRKVNHGQGGFVSDQGRFSLCALVKTSEKDPSRDADGAHEQSAARGHDHRQVRDIGLGRVQDHTGDGGTGQHAHTTGRVHESDNGRQLVRAKRLRQDQGDQGDVAAGKESVNKGKEKIDAKRLGKCPDDQDRACSHPGTEADDQRLWKTIGCKAERNSTKARGTAGETCDQGTVRSSETNEQAVGCTIKKKRKIGKDQDDATMNRWELSVNITHLGKKLTLKVIHGNEEPDRGSELGTGQGQKLRILENLEVGKEASDTGGLDRLFFFRGQFLCNLTDLGFREGLWRLRHLLAAFALNDQETSAAAKDMKKK